MGTTHRRWTRTATTLLAVALVITGCSGEDEPSVTDEAAALDAIAESFAGSWSWAGQLDVELSDGQVAEIVDLGAGDELGAAPDAVEQQVRTAVDEFDRQRMHGALGDDQSFRTAWERHGDDLVDLRLDFGEVLRAESLTPSASLVGAVDVAGILQFIRDLTAIDGRESLLVPTVETVRQQVEQAPLDPDERAMALAIVDGGFGGVTGQLDLAEMGVTEEQLAEVRQGFAEELIGLGDADTFRGLAAEAMTIRDLATADGQTVATVDLHPRAAAEAVYDLFDDAQGLAEDLGDSYVVDEDVPETIEEVARLTFDADANLVEVRTDVIAVAGQLAPAMELGPDQARLLQVLGDGRVEVVFAFGDHDAIDTVTDVDATTIPWDAILDFFRPRIEDTLE